MYGKYNIYVVLTGIKGAVVLQKKKKYFSSYKIMVYLITILVSLAFLGFISYFIVDSFIFKDVIKIKPQPKNKEVTTKNISEDNDTLNVIFGYENDQQLYTLMLVRFDSGNKSISCVPISTDTWAKVDASTGTIADFYEKKGIQGVCDAVENTFEVDVQRYMLLDRDSIEYLVDKLGGVYYTVPFEIKYTDNKTNEQATFSPRDTKRLLKGEDVRKIISYPFPESKLSDKPELIASLCVNLINQSVKSKDRIIKEMDSTFRELSEKSKTNISFEDYNTRKKSLIYIISNSKKPATFSIPIGMWDENAQYVVDGQYKKELKKYLYPS